MKIRLAKLEELNHLNELIQNSAKELSKEDYSPQEIEAAIRYIFGVDNELINDETYFVIENNDEIVGCGGWSKRKTLFGGDQFAGREEAVYLDPQKDAAKIRAFFIHPQYARQGLGSMLLKHCEQQAYFHGFTELEMMATLPGVKLYKARGYQCIVDEIVSLPNGTSLRFIRMNKKLIQSNTNSLKLQAVNT